MNTLCFFLKTARNLPGCEHPAPRKGNFQRSCQVKRQREHRSRRVVRGCRGGHFLRPKHSAARTEADASGQLDGPAPLLHQSAEQADVFFLRIPHRSHQTVQGSFQDQRVGLLQPFQPPDGPAALQRIPRPRREGGRQQDFRVFQQLFRPLCKVGIRAGGLFAEAGEIFLRRLVHRAQSRERRVAQPVAGVGIGGVRLVRHPALAACRADLLGLRAGQAEQRAAETGAAGPDARCAVETGPPRQPEQQRLGLVSSSMGGGDRIYPTGPQSIEAGIAELPRPVLPRMHRNGSAHVSRMEHAQRHVQPGAFGADKGFVPVGGLSPQAMVHMAGRQLVAEHWLDPQQQPEQRHAVGPARNSGAQPLPRREQLVFLREGAHFFHDLVHQRLKSTSIKRVCAPSQPSGTVLVSPWRFLATMHSAVSASTSPPSGFWLA